MNSIIFRTSTHIVTGLMIMFSLYLLLRGHNSPGGGFIAGLITTIAFALLMLAENPDYVRRRLYYPPGRFAGIGILIALASGCAPLFFGLPFLTGLWVGKTGTPILFDIGVFFAVFGAVLFILLSVEEVLS